MVDKQHGNGRFLSKTFADLDAPPLKWDNMTPSPVPRLDGAAIQINDLLFVFAGYGTIDLVTTITTTTLISFLSFTLYIHSFLTFIFPGSFSC